MNDPREQQPSQIWSRWRERRAARTPPTDRPSDGAAAEPPAEPQPPPVDPEPRPEPGTPVEPGTGPEPELPVDEGLRFESAPPHEPPRDPGEPPPDPGRDPGFGEGAGFERGSRFEPRSATGPPHGADGRECLEWCPICRTADVLRASVPPEIRDQWHDVQREALLTFRALIDHHIERLGEKPQATRVEDIPIE